MTIDDHLHFKQHTNGVPTPHPPQYSSPPTVDVWYDTKPKMAHLTMFWRHSYLF